MKTLLHLLVIALGVSAGVLQVADPPAKLVSTYYGVDFSQPASVSQMQCLAAAGYSTAFVRAYSPAGAGQYDPYACTSIHNAYPCMGTEVYMTPQPFSTKPGYMQFDEMYSGLKNNGIMMNSAWLQVVSPSHWSTNVQSNINFINSILSRMRQYGVKPGIYTSMSDWYTITGNWGGAGADVMLWYYSVRGGGVSNESPADFSDFIPFGSWQFPTAKQFGQVETICGLTVNRDIYVSPSPNFAAYLASLKGLDKNVKPETYPVGMIGAN